MMISAVRETWQELYGSLVGQASSPETPDWLFLMCGKTTIATRVTLAIYISIVMLTLCIGVLLLV
jgi:hypothetical protein